LFFIIKNIFWGNTTFIEKIIFFLIFIILGYICGKIFNLIVRFWKIKKIRFIIIFLLIIIFLFKFPLYLISSIKFEKTAKIYKGSSLIANIRLVEGDGDHYPLAYQRDPIKGYYPEYQSPEPFWDIDKECYNKYSKKCEVKITEQIKRQYGNYYGDEYTIKYGSYVLFISGVIKKPFNIIYSLLSHPDIDPNPDTYIDMCNKVWDTEFIFVPQRRLYLSDTPYVACDSFDE